jgi:hypothetical protein
MWLPFDLINLWNTDVFTDMNLSALPSNIFNPEIHAQFNRCQKMRFPGIEQTFSEVWD